MLDDGLDYLNGIDWPFNAPAELVIVILVGIIVMVTFYSTKQ